jgi:hypothetical protein
VVVDGSGADVLAAGLLDSGVGVAAAEVEGADALVETLGAGEDTSASPLSEFEPQAPHAAPTTATAARILKGLTTAP